jgi:hypothetical protein
MFEATIAALNAALKGVAGLRVDVSGFGTVDPPGVVVGPPTLTWGEYADNPTDATFDCVLYVPQDDRAIARLLRLLPLVRDAIETVEDAVVTTATPEVFRSGATDLPAYRITIEVSH